HQEDEICLETLLKGRWPAYIGLIGSKRRVSGLFERLIEKGYDKKKLNGIYTPIGLAIGAQTPEEIAISILSELIKVKRTVYPLKAKHNICFCYDTIEFLEQITSQKEPFAIVTILSTKGSTPRKAGAIMAVTNLGHTLGSIGGGCSENQVITVARNMIGSSSYKIVTLDLTNDFEEDEGMVCGGTMEVLIIG
ncbi:MAG: XdhC/CoxI family protein, partial [Niameybacter sp.]